MISTKRKKRSGLSGLELEVTMKAIQNLIATWQAEEADDDSEITQLETVLAMLQTKLDGRQSYSFSGMTFEHLKKFDISGGGGDQLKLKPDSMSRTPKTDSVGEEQWSAKGLYRHLCFLEGFVPRTNEAAARLWISPFFFRVATMLPGESKILLSVDQNVLPIAVNSISFNYLSGSVDFTVILTTKARAVGFFENPSLKNLSEQDNALFVSEAKGPDQRLSSHVPKAISGMYACAKQLNKTTIRGVLTNGHDWIFLIFELNADRNGGKYLKSDEIPLLTWTIEEGKSVSEASCSLIAGIIAHWTQHSHQKLGDDDYFTIIPIEY